MKRRRGRVEILFPDSPENIERIKKLEREGKIAYGGEMPPRSDAARRHTLGPFKKAEYQRQATFRDMPGCIAEAARTTAAGKSIRPGYLLTPGHEEQNLFPGLRGPRGAIHFFREREILWWREERVEDEKIRDRPTRHMASSQVACVNFLMPLAEHPGALVSMLRAIDSDVEGVLPIEHKNHTSLVEFEWIGAGDALEGKDLPRGAYSTSVDAFILARVPGGVRGYFIEWKYTEACGDELDGDHRTRVRRYRDLYEQSGLFRPPFETILRDPAYQLVRSLLLGFRSVKDGELGITEARTIVICPEGNDAYRGLPADHSFAGTGAAGVEELMHGFFLRDPKRFATTSQRVLIQALLDASVALPPGWAEYHKNRYSWR